MARKKISTTIYITPEQNERLKLLHERTKVPVAVYIREGIDLVLERHRDRAARPAHARGCERVTRSSGRPRSADHAAAARRFARAPSARVADVRSVRPHAAHADRSQSYPQLLHHRAHRSRQEHAGRPHPRVHGALTRPRDAGRSSSTRWSSSASAASPSRRRPCGSKYKADDGKTYQLQPDRHARATSTSPTRCRARSPRARARCWWSTRRRASRRRRSPTSTWRSRTTSRSSRSSTRSICRAPTSIAREREVEEVIGLDCERRDRRQRQDRASASRRSSRRS